MKNILFLTTLFLFACNQSNEKIEPTTDSEPLPVEMKQDSILHFGNESFLVTDYSNEKLFQGISCTERIEESIALENDKQVARNGESLVFTLNNGETVSLENIPYDESVDEMDVAIYEFIGSVENSNYWEVFAMGYEYHWYILINKNTGEQIAAHGKSSCSPNGKYILAANPDLDVQFTTNGLELYYTNNDELMLAGKIELESWEPLSMLWLNDSEIVITEGHFDEGSEYYEMIYSNILLTLIEKNSQ